MKLQHRRKSKPKKSSIEVKDGQRKPLCCNKGIGRCPSLIYKLSENEGDIEGAFKILFDILFKRDV